MITINGTDANHVQDEEKREPNIVTQILLNKVNTIDDSNLDLEMLTISNEVNIKIDTKKQCDEALHESNSITNTFNTSIFGQICQAKKKDQAMLAKLTPEKRKQILRKRREQQCDDCMCQIIIVMILGGIFCFIGFLASL